MNKNLIITLASQIWEEAPAITLKDNAITVHNLITEEPMYEIAVEGESVVYVEMKRKYRFLGYHDLLFINLIDENASEISKIEEN